MGASNLLPFLFHLDGTSFSHIDATRMVLEGQQPAVNGELIRLFSPGSTLEHFAFTKHNQSPIIGMFSYPL